MVPSWRLPTIFQSIENSYKISDPIIYLFRRMHTLTQSAASHGYSQIAKKPQCVTRCNVAMPCCHTGTHCFTSTWRRGCQWCVRFGPNFPRMSPPLMRSVNLWLAQAFWYVQLSSPMSSKSRYICRANQIPGIEIILDLLSTWLFRFDWDTNRIYLSPGAIYTDTPLEKIPVYQRGGTIIPVSDGTLSLIRIWFLIKVRERPRRSSKAQRNDPITLYIASQADKEFANGTIYLDDGETHNYRDHNEFLYYVSFPFKIIY